MLLQPNGGEQWLAELDAIKPTSDDERSALDIARVENIQAYGDPARILAGSHPVRAGDAE